MVTLNTLSVGDLFKLPFGSCVWKVLDVNPSSYSNSILCECVFGPERQPPFIKSSFLKFLEVKPFELF